MVTCSIESCKNRPNQLTGRKIKFFSFPKIPEVFEKWLEICPVKHDNLKTNGQYFTNIFVFEKHFSNPRTLFSACIFFRPTAPLSSLGKIFLNLNSNFQDQKLCSFEENLANLSGDEEI